MATAAAAFKRPVVAPRKQHVPLVGLTDGNRAYYERTATLACYGGLPGRVVFGRHFPHANYNTVKQAVEKLQECSKEREEAGFGPLAYTDDDYSLLRSCDEATGFSEYSDEGRMWTPAEGCRALLSNCLGKLTAPAASKVYGPSVKWFEKWRGILREKLGVKDLKDAGEERLSVAIAELPICCGGAQPALLPHDAALLVGHMCALTGAGGNASRAALRAFGLHVLLDAAEHELCPKRRARLERMKCSNTWLKGVIETSRVIGGPNATFRKAHDLPMLRAQAASPEREKEYRQNAAALFDEVLGKGVRPSADTIWGGDEAAFGLARCMSTLAEKGTEAVFRLTKGEHFPYQVTMFYWNNAALGAPAGLPLEVVHKGKEYSLYHLLNLPEDALFAMTESGYQDKDTFRSAVGALVEFIRREREDGMVDPRPHFVHLDAHFSHMDAEALEMLYDANIFPFFIPSHTSHFLQSADCGLQSCLKAIVREICNKTLGMMHAMDLSIPLINGMLAEAWPIFQERSVAAAQSAYKKVGLFPFKTAEEVKRTTAELLLIQKAGDTVTADDFKAAAAAEREEERREEEAAEAKRREEEEAELSARRDDLRKRQAEEAQAVMARHAAELKAMRERHRREGQALEEAGSTSKGKRKFVSFAGTEAELSDSQKRSRPRHRAGQAAGAAAAPSAEQQAIADHLLAGALTVPEAMEAALEAPAAPGQLFLPAYNASGGEVVMRHTVVASVAKQRGFTAAQEVQRLEEEKAAKAIKGKRRGAKGVINTSRGAVVTAEAIAKLRADDKEAKEKAEASKAARAGRTREKLQKAAADIAEGKLIAERADIVSARAAGDSQALKQILGKLKVDEMRKLITAIDSSKLPKTKLKKDNAEALVSLSYWTQLNQQLADPETLTGDEEEDEMDLDEAEALMEFEEGLDGEGE